MLACFGCGTSTHHVSEPKSSKRSKKRDKEEKASVDSEEEDDDEEDGSNSDETRSFLEVEDQRSEASIAESATVDALVSISF